MRDIMSEYINTISGSWRGMFSVIITCLLVYVGFHLSYEISNHKFGLLGKVSSLYINIAVIAAMIPLMWGLLTTQFTSEHKTLTTNIAKTNQNQAVMIMDKTDKIITRLENSDVLNPETSQQMHYTIDEIKEQYINGVLK